jgi:hypothetical protein
MALVEKLRGKFVALAVSQFGSFCVEKCSTQADLPRRTRIAKELVAGEATLLNTKTYAHTHPAYPRFIPSTQ